MMRELLIEQVVPDYRSWLRTVATGLIGSTHEAIDDLVQEGNIAMWRAIASFDPDASPANYWLKRSAHQRMLTVLARDFAWTGRPGRYDGGHGGNQPPQRVLSFTELSVNLDYDFDVEDVLFIAALDNVLWAYHEGDFRQAFDLLTERERLYVHRRFWQGMQMRELDTLFGIHSPNIWKTAKPKLREQLAHLITL